MLAASLERTADHNVALLEWPTKPSVDHPTRRVPEQYLRPTVQ
ncbi:hypothetical protein R5R35_002662 [Gryllus longicercus]|uniref:Uncharacterized protein n=1 Tax=Gryllus longicercus TaxID=2509291 RepID=A0AAN9ZFL4_9ORTH